jgi:CubicO group peptidase (beta-lactamase class C family)
MMRRAQTGFTGFFNKYLDPFNPVYFSSLWKEINAMTHRRSSTTSMLSRRTALGALAAAPMAAGALLTASGTVRADTHFDHSRCKRPPRTVPADLLPGGEFERFVSQRAAQDQFSGNVLLAYRGRPVLIRSYGMANKQLSIPNDADTIFNLASVTKCFTSIAIAQLVQQERVAFYETLGTYLDGFPAEIANTVTVHQLLTHTSGMGDYSNSPAVQSGKKEWNSAAETMDGVMAIIRQSPLLFAPGTRYGYSNSGFFVLGAIVEQVSGQSYFDYIRQHVFAPAEMTRSDFYTRPQVLSCDDIAHPYWTQQSGDRADFTMSEHFGFIGGPADGAYSTVSDLLSFAGALRAGRLLGPSFTELITGSKVVLSPSDPPVDPNRTRFYGYGYRNTFVENERVFGHSGSGPGRATNLDIYPELDWVAVVLSNYDTPVAPVVQLERQLIINTCEEHTHDERI